MAPWKNFCSNNITRSQKRDLSSASEIMISRRNNFLRKIIFAHSRPRSSSPPRRNYLPALISSRAAREVTKYPPASGTPPLLESPETRLSDAYFTVVIPPAASSHRSGQWSDTYVTLKPPPSGFNLAACRSDGFAQKTIWELQAYRERNYSGPGKLLLHRTH